MCVNCKEKLQRESKQKAKAKAKEKKKRHIFSLRAFSFCSLVSKRFLNYKNCRHRICELVFLFRILCPLFAWRKHI